MITKEEIICGTPDELIEYFETNFKFTERSDENDAKGFTYYTLPHDDIGNLDAQLNRIIKKDIGLVFFFKYTPDVTNKLITMTILKFWVFVRAPLTNDA